MYSRGATVLWSVLLALSSLVLSCLALGQALPVYVVNAGGTVEVIDFNSNTTSIAVNGGSGRCDGRDGIAPNPPYLTTTAAVSPDGALLYVVAHQTNTVEVFDLTTAPPSPKFLIPVGDCPQNLALSPDGTRLYVAETGQGTLSVFDTTTTPPQLVSPPIILGGETNGSPEPFGIAVSLDGNTVYVSDQVGLVDRIDTNPSDGSTYNTVQGRCSIPQPANLAISSDGTNLAVQSGGAVYLIPSAQFGSLGCAAGQIFQFPNGIAFGPLTFSPDGTQILVASATTSNTNPMASLYDINISPPSETAYPNVLGSVPAWMTYNSDESLLYVTNTQSNSVSLLQANGFNPKQPVLANEPLGAASLLPVSAPVNSNGPTQAGAVSVTFFGPVSATGSTSPSVVAKPISTAQLPALSGYSITNSAWDVSIANGSYTGSAVVCFTLASITDPNTFSSLRVLHYVNGVPQDVTQTTSPYQPNFSTHTICGGVTSFSPFVIAKLGGSNSGGGASTSTNINAQSTTYGSAATVNVYVSSNSGPVSGNVSLTIDGAPGPSQYLSNGSSTFYVSGLTAGSHTVSATFPQQSNFSSSSSSLSYLYMSPASLAVTATSTSRPYGSANPQLSGSVSGLQYSDNISATFSTTATQSSPAGQYPITASLSDPSNRLGNYSVTTNNGTLTVTTVPLTITANNSSKVLDAANPSFSASYAGFVLSDGSSSLSGSLNCTTTATQTSPVGSYPITCSGLSSTNYSIIYVSGTLKILYAAASTTALCDGDIGHQILQPINADGSSVWKQGRTIPAQFRVCNFNGYSVGTAGVVSGFRLTQIIAGTVTNVDETVSSTSSDTAFHWDATNQLWVFNIGTSNLSANYTYVYMITLNDGTTIGFQYGLK